jgi:hypothetical protein
MELRPFAAWFGAMAFGRRHVFVRVNLLPILFCGRLPLTCMFARRYLCGRISRRLQERRRLSRPAILVGRRRR